MAILYADVLLGFKSEIAEFKEVGVETQRRKFENFLEAEGQILVSLHDRYLGRFKYSTIRENLTQEGRRAN